MFTRLRVAALAMPLVLVATLEIFHWLVGPWVSPWVDTFLVGALAAVVVALFYAQVIDRLAEVRKSLERQNRELLSLHQAGLSVVADLSLESVLQTVVDRARSLIETEYGAISIIDDESEIVSFLTSGLPADAHARIGDPPRGRGLLGVVLEQGTRLRLDDIARDPRSVGFPPHHPPMHTLLAVPVVCKGPFRGNLYLSEKTDGTRFTAQDEETLVRFAAQAAIAIDNAYLHRQVRQLGAAEERLRIAHEMHDGLAQVLAYVNTKAQVVREHLRQERPEEAEEHLEQLADAARSCYADVRGHILELRTASAVDQGLEEGIREFVQSWSRQTGVAAEVDVTASLGLAPEAELQLLRILQEALSNVRKHSEATRVWVRVHGNEDRVRLSVADDGVGIAATSERDLARPRFGLTTMRERAESVHGALEITSRAGEGTRVELSIPRRTPGREVVDALADR